MIMKSVVASNCKKYFYKIFSLKAKVKRPLRIVAKYIDEDGKNNEIELTDFQARVFCHEYDHLIGKTILDWKNSNGDIIIEGEEKFDRINYIQGEEIEFKYKNFYLTWEHYRNRILYEGGNRPNIFEKFDIQLVNKEFDSFSEEQLSIQNELRGKKNWNIEDIMWIDLERAYRKDMNIKVKRSSPALPMEDYESEI